MKKVIPGLALFLISLTIWSFQAISRGGDDKQETRILLQTSMGDIKLKLYNATPQHRDNFIKLVRNKAYDNCLFHRVIQSFMIQGGDPDSKKAGPGVMLGNGNVGYTVPAEFKPELFHKKGVLAAARMGDDVNPSKESSGCQFYIVQGKGYTHADLDMYEDQINMQLKQRLFSVFINKEENKALREKFMTFQQEGRADSLQTLSMKIDPELRKEIKNYPHFQFTEEQRKAYTTVGGAPHLDGNYTVFGEVLEGMEVVDKIAAVPVDQNSRPLADVRIVKATIIK